MPTWPAFTFAAALDVLFPEGAPSAASACASASPPSDAPLCLIGVRYRDDLAARDTAVALYRRTGSLPGLAVAYDSVTSLRGTVHLVPELPVGPYRRHLEWTEAAFARMDRFFTALGVQDYRYGGLAIRYMSSTGGRTTPSATMLSWTLEYNVRGAIHTGPERVAETLFHEVFHGNDQAHGWWSMRALTPIYTAILAKCGQDTACLAPYAPARTIVRTGTYYAFDDDNDVREYAAELAIRYFVEHEAILAGAPVEPFKCRTPENTRAWDALVTEFFRVDRTPPCR